MPAVALLLASDQLAHSIDMPRNHMTAEAVADTHRAFEIHPALHLQAPKVCQTQSLAADIKPCGVAKNLRNRQTRPIHGDAFAELKLPVGRTRYIDAKNLAVRRNA